MRVSRAGNSGRKRPLFVRLVGITAVLLLVVIATMVVGLFLLDGFLFEPMNEGARPATLPDSATMPGDSDIAAGTGERIFEIKPNQSLRTISRRMVGEGLARNALAVELYGRLQGYAARLQAGRYLVSSRMPPVEILEKIATGDAVFDELTITIPEGWSANDIELYLEGLGLFTKEEFAPAVVMQPAYRDFPLLAPLEDDTILDGYLFPDTYRIFEDSTPHTIVRRMLDNFHLRMSPSLLAEVEQSEMTLHEIVTLASIVQSEADGPEQMPDVAGVFSNRLRDRIRLESDAT
ncbi:MAG: endolytic transglycosylase MltG, partial [Spirochaetales bacterium]